MPSVKMSHLKLPLVLPLKMERGPQAAENGRHINRNKWRPPRLAGGIPSPLAKPSAAPGSPAATTGSRVDPQLFGSLHWASWSPQALPGLRCHSQAQCGSQVAPAMAVCPMQFLGFGSMPSTSPRLHCQWHAQPGSWGVPLGPMRSSGLPEVTAFSAYLYFWGDSTFQGILIPPFKRFFCKLGKFPKFAEKSI